MFKTIYQYFPIVLLFLNCSSNTNTPKPMEEMVDPNSINALTFIDEFIIPEQQIDGVPMGGLSGIDYHNNKWYLICDTSTPPIRYYEANISFTNTGFDKVEIVAQNEIKDASGSSLASGIVDPESIRVDISSGNLIYCSEGSINNVVDPALIEISAAGNQIKSFTLPEYFKANIPDNLSGPRHNGVFEGLSLSSDGSGYWVSTELPLKEDGPEPTTTETESPVRITYFNKTSGVAEKQFAYELDLVARKATLGTTFEINGLVEILQYDKDQFLALERSFSSGYLDGGNTVKIYKVDASEASNTLSMNKLFGATYTKATKTLLFNFETIRSQLTNNTVDNLEGLTFGPVLSDGSRTLVVISDNNFNSFFPQLNQLIAFRVVP